MVSSEVFSIFLHFLRCEGVAESMGNLVLKYTMTRREVWILLMLGKKQEIHWNRPYDRPMTLSHFLTFFIAKTAENELSAFFLANCAKTAHQISISTPNLESARKNLLEPLYGVSGLFFTLKIVALCNSPKTNIFFLGIAIFLTKCTWLGYNFQGEKLPRNAI